MPRMNILNKSEQEMFDAPPVLVALSVNGFAIFRIP